MSALRIQWISHRVNTAAGLAALNPLWGVEMDLRSSVTKPGELHLAHDPWVKGESFESWLQAFKQAGLKGPIILNTKEDALEERVIQLLDQHGISNFFFLDTTIPTLNKWALNKGESRFAVRLSRIEPVASVQPFIGKVQWLWVDCFDGTPLDSEILKQVRPYFKVCLVSPELQAQPIERIADFHALLPLADAVCTKQPLKWQQHYRLI